MILLQSRKLVSVRLQNDIPVKMVFHPFSASPSHALPLLTGQREHLFHGLDKRIRAFYSKAKAALSLTKVSTQPLIRLASTGLPQAATSRRTLDSPS